jgi:hypothetical protein
MLAYCEYLERYHWTFNIMWHVMWQVIMWAFISHGSYHVTRHVMSYHITWLDVTTAAIFRPGPQGAPVRLSSIGSVFVENLVNFSYLVTKKPHKFDGFYEAGCNRRLINRNVDFVLRHLKSISVKSGNICTIFFKNITIDQSINDKWLKSHDNVTLA